jgi:glycosyltransferase involved in cell wall biosynthesis
VGGLEGRFYRWLERLAAAWCRTIVTLSAFERDAGLAAGIGRPEQYCVIPNGVELERFGRPREPVPGRILWLGRLAPPKRPDLALRAVALARSKVPAAHLHVVGEGVQGGELEALSAELQLGDAVRFLGTRDDVPDLLASAECVLLASDYEGCPLAVLEALAAGVPVVATSVGGIPEILDHDRTGLLVEPGSPGSLAAALIELLSSPGRAAELGFAGRRVAAARFSIERMTADVVGLYRAIDTGSN